MGDVATGDVVVSGMGRRMRAGSSDAAAEVGEAAAALSMILRMRLNGCVVQRRRALETVGLHG